MRSASTVNCAVVLTGLLAAAAPAHAARSNTQGGKKSEIALPASVRYDAQAVQLLSQKTGKLVRYSNPIGGSAASRGWREPTRSEDRAIRAGLRATLGRSRLPAHLRIAVMPESGQLRVRATPAGQRPGHAVDAEGYFSARGGLRLLDQHGLLLGKGSPLRNTQKYEVRRILSGGATVGPVELR